MSAVTVSKRYLVTGDWMRVTITGKGFVARFAWSCAKEMWKLNFLASQAQGRVDDMGWFFPLYTQHLSYSAKTYEDPYWTLRIRRGLMTRSADARAGAIEGLEMLIREEIGATLEKS